MSRLAQTEAHCVALFLPSGSGAAPVPSLLAEESLQGYAMLVSGHFQGFCRDLYTECSHICVAAAVPAGLRPAVQAQFGAELKLNTGNPTVENIRKDFERFGFQLSLAIDPANLLRITHLGQLNYWRNSAAHQKTAPPPAGIPSVLTLTDVQTWRTSCDGLATSLDDIMYHQLLHLLSVAPW